MNTKRICRECGAPLPEEAPEGLCPKCLMKVGLGSQPPGTEAQSSPAGSQPAPSANALPDPAKLAEYFPQLEILELLGQGGMGAVYKARQPALDRLVALKILPSQAAADPGFAARFSREARALARLSHPNIVAVYDFGQTHGLHYFIMEFVDGSNLRHIEQAGKLSPTQALQIIPQICEALQFAHNEGVVHRDIKPENVLLDKKGRVKIADFGLAMILGRETQNWRLTGAKDVMGTPHYMAPEQVEHPRDVDHRADIYSLGVVFYEMLTGELPLGKFAPPSRKVQVDVRLDEVVLHALEKEPQRRYQQASQVKCDVETIAGTPGTASGAPAPAGAGAPVSGDVWRQVKGPAIGLVITGIFNWISIPFLMRVGVAIHRHSLRHWYMVLRPMLALAIAGLIFLAGLKMRRLEAFGLSVGGAVLAILTAPGNLIGLPVGIWALAVLSHREIRSAFALKAQGRSVPPPPPVTAGAGGAWKVVAVIVAGLILVLGVPVVATLASIVVPAFYKSRVRAQIMKNQVPAFVVDGDVRDAVTGKLIAGARVADNYYGASPKRAPQEAWTDALVIMNSKPGMRNTLSPPRRRAIKPAWPQS